MVGTKEMEPHPNVSRAMYGDLIKSSKEKYGMEMLFTDFLCYRGPSMAGYTVRFFHNALFFLCVY